MKRDQGSIRLLHANENAKLQKKCYRQSIILKKHSDTSLFRDFLTIKSRLTHVGRLSKIKHTNPLTATPRQAGNCN